MCCFKYFSKCFFHNCLVKLNLSSLTNYFRGRGETKTLKMQGFSSTVFVARSWLYLQGIFVILLNFENEIYKDLKLFNWQYKLY